MSSSTLHLPSSAPSAQRCAIFVRCELDVTLNARKSDLHTCLRSSLRLAISTAFSSLVIPVMLPAAEEDGAAGNGGEPSLKSSSQLPGTSEATDGEGAAAVEGACAVERGGDFCWGVDGPCGLIGCERLLNKGGGDGRACAGGSAAGGIAAPITGIRSLLSWSRLSSHASSSSRVGPL